MKLALQSSVGDCGFYRHLYGCQSPRADDHKGMDLSDEEDFQAESLVPACEVEIVCQPLKSSDEAEQKQRQKQRQQHLYDMVGPSGISDDETIESKQLDEAFARLIELQRLSKAEIEDLEGKTKDQHKSELWHREHIGRVTSSIVHRILQRKQGTAPDKLVALLMGYTSGRDTLRRSRDPRQHGHDLEETARQKYSEYMLDHGNRVTVSQHGLFVSADHPFLGSSVDGIVHCADGSKGVLEIKCPVAEAPLEILAKERISFCLS